MPVRRRSSVSDDGTDSLARSGRQVKHILKACDPCRRRKMRCDGMQPACAACGDRGTECVYSEEDKRKGSLKQIDELRSRMERMEQLLNGLVPVLQENGASQSAQTSLASIVHPSHPLRLDESRPSRADSPLAENSNSANEQRYLHNVGRSSLSPEVLISQRMELGEDHEEGRFQRIGPSAGSLAYSGGTSLWTYSAGQEQLPGEHIAMAQESRALQPGDWVHWSQSLPSAINVSKDVHDQALEYFKAYYAPWCLVLDMNQFVLDLRWCNTIRKKGASRPLPPTRTAHYSPLLHCCVLYLGLYLIRDRYSGLMEAYDSVFIQHCSNLLYVEGDSGSIGSLRGYNLFAICAHCVRSSAPDYQGSAIPKPTMTGFLYAGIGMAGVHALSLNVDCSIYVERGQITSHEKNIRDYAFWSLHIVDALRAIPHGRQPVMAHSEGMQLPVIDRDLDDTPWLSPVDDQVMQQLISPPLPLGAGRSMQSTTFHHLASLSCIVRQMMRTLYIPRDRGARDSTAVQDLSHRLDQWYAELPLKPAHLIPLPHVLTLHLVFHLVVILVHRLFYRSNWMGSKQRCEEAADEIMTLLKLFQDNQDLRYAHHNITNVIFAAATIFLLSYAGASASDPKRAKGMEMFDCCIENMKRLGQTWPEATKASNVLESLKAEFIVPPTSIMLARGADGNQMPTADVDLDGLHQWLSGQDFWGTFFPDQHQWAQSGWDGIQGINTGLLS